MKHGDEARMMSPVTKAEERPRLSVVVLAYNERDNLPSSVAELLGVLRGLGVSFELLVVDDGSTDGTGDLADELTRVNPELRVAHHGLNRGLGGGYRTGFAQARGEFVSFYPADGQFPADILADFLPRMRDADLVLGYLPERPASLVAKGLSFTERLLYRALFGSMPRFQGVLMLRRSLLDTFELRSTGRGWAVLLELILRVSRGPHRAICVPTSVRPRRSGRSKVNNLRTIVSNLAQVLSLRLALLR